MPHMPWIRLYVEFATDPVIQSLSFEDQRHYILVLCLKGQNVLDRDIPTANRERLIARTLGLDPEAAREAKRRLMEVKLIEKDWQPRGWNNRQFDSDHSTPRVSKYRKTKKAGNVAAPFLKRRETVTETDQNRTEQNRNPPPSKSPPLPQQSASIEPPDHVSASAPGGAAADGVDQSIDVEQDDPFALAEPPTKPKPKPKAKPKARQPNAPVDYHPAFESFWTEYPRRPNEPKLRAFKAWQARRKQGVAPADMIAAAQRYAAWAKAHGKAGTSYTLMAATFLGPDGHWQEPWADRPARGGNGANGSGHGDNGEAIVNPRRLSDTALVAMADSLGVPSVGKSRDELIARIERKRQESTR